MNLAISTKPRRQPSRIILHALEKWGKTSFAAQAPKPVFLMTKGEDGLATLINEGLLPETAHFTDPADNWNSLRASLQSLLVTEHSFRTLVLDTLNGAQALCFQHIMENQTNNNWKDFQRWDHGPSLAAHAWVDLLAQLDSIRTQKNMSILLLCHTAVQTFKNPEGADYDRYQPDLNRKHIWPLSHKWADIILFGHFETYTNAKTADTPKAKATGGQGRIILTERHAAYDAGNRHGLPPEIDASPDPGGAWANFAAALRKNNHSNTTPCLTQTKKTKETP